MLTSLRSVLSTVSDNFQEQIFLRFPLIGKSQDEIEEFLQKPENTSQILSFLSQFVDEMQNRCGEKQ